MDSPSADALKKNCANKELQMFNPQCPYTFAPSKLSANVFVVVYQVIGKNPEDRSSFTCADAAVGTRSIEEANVNERAGLIGTLC
jgi:hypothetical protein